MLVTHNTQITMQNTFGAMKNYFLLTITGFHRGFIIVFYIPIQILIVFTTITIQLLKHISFLRGVALQDFLFIVVSNVPNLIPLEIFLSYIIIFTSIKILTNFLIRHMFTTLFWLLTVFADISNNGLLLLILIDNIRTFIFRFINTIFIWILH